MTLKWKIENTFYCFIPLPRACTDDWWEFMRLMREPGTLQMSDVLLKDYDCDSDEDIIVED